MDSVLRPSNASFKTAPHILKRKRERYRANPDPQIIRVQNGRASRIGVPGQLTLEDWLYLKEQYGNRCAYCGASSFKLHIDHLQPLSLYRKGVEEATNTIENCVPACELCNLAKSDRPFLIFMAWKYGMLSC